MRIALHPSSEVGIRAGRLLLGEHALETLGVLDHPVDGRDPRVERINTIEGFDVVVTDDQELTVARKAIASGIPLVVWVDGDELETRDAAAPVMTGANLASGITRAVAARESALGASTTLVAWTEPGKPLRTGEPVTFPDPVGARWGKVRSRTDSTTEVVVPVPEAWAGAVVRATIDNTTRILGIADLASHLESLALAAGAVTLGTGTHPPGRLLPRDLPDAYLLAALRAGLDIASFTAA